MTEQLMDDRITEVTARLKELPIIYVTHKPLDRIYVISGTNMPYGYIFAPEYEHYAFLGDAGDDVYSQNKVLGRVTRRANLYASRFGGVVIFR